MGELPATGEVVDVELDVEEPLVVGDTLLDLGAASGAPPGSLTATVETAADDNILIVRLGPASSNGDRPPPTPGAPTSP